MSSCPFLPILRLQARTCGGMRPVNADSLWVSIGYEPFCPRDSCAYLLTLCPENLAGQPSGRGSKIMGTVPHLGLGPGHIPELDVSDKAPNCLPPLPLLSPNFRQTNKLPNASHCGCLCAEMPSEPSDEWMAPSCVQMRKLL